MTRPDRRELLADDLRRLAGLAEAAVGEAHLLSVARCVAAWRHWGSQLREQERDNG